MRAQHLQALGACILLAGCGTAPPAPTVRVDVPVFVPCVTAVPARPVFEFDKLGPAASDGDKILALARDWPRGRAYEGALEAVVEGCRVEVNQSNSPGRGNFSTRALTTIYTSSLLSDMIRINS